MREETEIFSGGHGMKEEFPAINVPLFFIKRVNEKLPQPTQYYHYHDCYEIYYLFSGARYYFIKDKTYQIDAGTLVFIEPDTIHCTGNYEKYGYDRTVLYFKKEYIDSLTDVLGCDGIDAYLSSCHVSRLDRKSRTFIETMLEDMAEFHSDGTAETDTYLKTAMTHLLLFLCSRKGCTDVPSVDCTNSTRKVIFEIIGYINNNFKDKITLADISERYYISPCYFSRTFRTVTGMSFTEYLNNVRIKEARILLEKSDMRIIDIAENVGYSSNCHFGRVFRSVVGMSPLAYRNSKK